MRVVINHRVWVIVTALSPDGDRIGDNQSVHLVLSIAYVRVREQAFGNKQCTDNYKTDIMVVIMVVLGCLGNMAILGGHWSLL